MRKSKEIPIIGWREAVSIPVLGVKNIKVKIDTGARTSALHVTKLKIVKRGRSQFAEFYMHPKQRSSAPRIKGRAKIDCFRTVKSSNGISSKRPVIIVEFVISDTRHEIELTLVDRDMMGFRMLLGRTAVKNRFLVNPGKSFLLSKR